MSALFPDTDPQIEAIQIQLLRCMPSWKKMAILGYLNEMVRMLVISGIKERYPHATSKQIHRMLAELMLGAELARKVYDHDK